MATTNQIIAASAGEEYVEVTDALASGLLSVGTTCVFATGTAVPDSSLKGHILRPGEPRRYNLTALRIYVKADEDKSITVIVDEDE